jgi:hypothetical protein
MTDPPGSGDAASQAADAEGPNGKARTEGRDQQNGRTQSMRSLKIEPLGLDRIDQAFPLVQMLRPSLKPEAWQSYARALIEGADTGIVALADERGLLLGLFGWRVAQHPDHGRTLHAQDFVALDLVEPVRVSAILAAALEDTARRCDCHAVHTDVAAGAGPGARRLVERLGGLGHRMESFKLCKELPALG